MLNVALLLQTQRVMQDPVPRVGKFWVLFARPGQRVLVNQGGDMQVRPTPLDRRLIPLTPGQPLSPFLYVPSDRQLLGRLPFLACLSVVCLSVWLSVPLSICVNALSSC